METRGLTRRDTLLAAVLPVLGAGPAAAQERASDGRTLVAYLSRSGNTRVIAGALSRRYGADLFEIRTAEPYPADYEETVERAQAERDAEATPPLTEGVADITAYETVFIGFPIWGMALPAPMRTFLTTHELAGKTIVPFITHGGYGTGTALDTVAELAPQARIVTPLDLGGRPGTRNAEQRGGLAWDYRAGTLSPIIAEVPPPGHGRKRKEKLMTIRGPVIPLNNGVEMPAIGLGVFQTPPDATTAAVEEALRARLPPRRHRRRLRQRARGRRGHPPFRARPRRGVHRDQGLDQRLRLRRNAARLRQERGQARRRADRPLAPAPAAALGVRPHARRLPGARDAARRRPGARHRRQQLHARAPRPPARRGLRRAGREPDRGPPLLPADRAAAPPRRARHPDPGLVADRRHHLLPGRRARAPSTTRRLQEIADRARQDAGPGHAALAPRRGPLRDPEVGPARAHRRELRRLRLRAHPRGVAAIDALDTGVRGGPDPDSITLEAYGREIPEA